MDSGDAITKAVAVIDAMEARVDARSVINIFADFASRFGFTSVAAGQLANPASSQDAAAIRLSTWPKAWADYWVENRLFYSDPIAKMAAFHHRSFQWRDAFWRFQRFSKPHDDTLKEFGFTNGLAVPVNTGDGPPGCISLGCERLDLAPSEQAMIELAAIHCYVKLEKLYGVAMPFLVRDLTQRESEILHYVAAGKTNWEIGQILSISEYHVRDCLKNVFKKLNAVSRAQAVATAIREKLIFI